VWTGASSPSLSATESRSRSLPDDSTTACGPSASKAVPSANDGRGKEAVSTKDAFGRNRWGCPQLSYAVAASVKEIIQIPVISETDKRRQTEPRKLDSPPQGGSTVER
jgi:hypothetical protein